MTDHYAEANRLIDALHGWQSCEGEGETDAAMLTIAALAAQAEATLELANQQRIANLIALNEQWEESEHPDWYAQPQRLRPEITRALRIETQ